MKDEKKKKEVRKKQRNFARDHPYLFYIILIIIVVTSFNIGLFLPLRVLGILYDIEYSIVQFFLLPIILQRWEFFIIAAILLVIGYFAVPIVWIPSTGEWFIYTKTWSDGKLRYFKKLLDPYVRAFPEEWAAKKGLKWICLGRVKSREENSKLKVIAYQSDNIEVTKALWEKEHTRALEQRIIQLENDLAKGVITLPPEYAELITEILARIRGEI